MVEVEELVEAGWPNARMTTKKAARRLYFAIWALRDLGLHAVLQTGPTGYRVHPSIAIEGLP